MFRVPIVGRVGDVRVNSVDDNRDALNVRIAKDDSRPKRDGEGYEDVTEWVSVAFFKAKGGFDKMKDTVFRVGNVVEIDARLAERSRTIGDQNINELTLVGLGINVLHWHNPNNGAGGGEQGGSSQSGDSGDQASGNAGSGGNNADSFDDDIPF